MFPVSLVRPMAALMLVAAAAGCTTAPVTHTVTDSQADLRVYRTFGFYEAGNGEYPAATVDRLQQATRAQLQRRGYTYVERNPELRVNILLKVEGGAELRTVPTAAGRFAYRGWVTSAVETVHYPEGTLAIDVVDTKRNAMIWHGVTADRIGRSGLANPGATIDAAVRGLFAVFPVSSS